jgi:hypothetical protein
VTRRFERHLQLRQANGVEVSVGPQSRPVILDRADGRGEGLLGLGVVPEAGTAPKEIDCAIQGVSESGIEFMLVVAKEILDPLDAGEKLEEVRILLLRVDRPIRPAEPQEEESQPLREHAQLA